MSIQIRPATPADAPALLNIYAPYVAQTAVSFEYEVPTLEDFRSRIAQVTGAGWPWLAAQESGELLGYAYARPFHPRAAFAHCAEVTIYLHPDRRGQGLGRTLYAALEERLARQGVCNLYASITVTSAAEDPYLTAASPAFHAAMGYRLIGRFLQCGWKFGRWYDMVWMEKFLGPHGPEGPALPRPTPQDAQ